METNQNLGNISNNYLQHNLELIAVNMLKKKQGKENKKPMSLVMTFQNVN